MYCRIFLKKRTKYGKNVLVGSSVGPLEICMYIIGRAYSTKIIGYII